MNICIDLVEEGLLLMVVYISVLLVALVERLFLLLSFHFAFFDVSGCGRVDKIVDIKGIF